MFLTPGTEDGYDVIAILSSDKTAVDLYSDMGYYPDNQNDVTTTDNGDGTLTISRSLDTSDDLDYVIPADSEWLLFYQLCTTSDNI